ncbi:MAG: hypothetical protein K2L16_01045 [Muribaculaceae bacterium]|nr:hypothetical protein [Muribaculaceae bacterium]
MKKILYIVILSALLAVAASARTAPKSVSDEDRLKADYVFMEAASCRNSGSLTDYYMLLRRAATLNPSDPYIAGALAEIDILLPTVDSAATMDAFRTLERRVYLEPSVQHYWTYFTKLAMQMRRYDDAIAVWEMLDSLQPNRTDPAKNLARTLTAKGATTRDTASLLRAVDIYARLQETQPGNMELVTAKMQTLMLLADTTAMVDELRRLSREAPDEVPAMLFISAHYTAMERPDTAKAYLDRATELDPDNGLVRMMRAGYYNYQGDSVAYRTEVLAALESPNLEYEQKYGILRDFVSTVYEDSTRRDDVELMFNTVQEVNPGEPTLHQLFGDYYSEIGNSAGAAEQYGYSVDLDPGLADAWDGLIRSLGELEDYDRLLEVARETQRRYPADIYAGLMGASALGMRDMDAQAVAMLDSIRIVPEHNPKALSQVFLYKGDLLYRLGQTDSALVAYDRSIAYNADNYMALNNAAYFMAESGRDLPRAEVYASIANAGDPDNPTFLDTQAWVCFKMGNYAKALELINRTLALMEAEVDESADDDDGDDKAEPSADVLEHAGDIYFLNARPREAVEFWRRALDLNPDSELLRKKVTNEAYYYE